MDRFTAHLDRAWDWISKGDTTRALVSARRALEIDMESPEVHNLIGYIRAMDGDLDEALTSYKQAMILDDEYLDPVLNTAELLVHPDADPKEAIRILRNVSQMMNGPEAVDAILLEVDALLNLGSIEDARRRLSDIEDPESLPIHYAVFMGRALYETGDLDGAEEYFRKSVTDDDANGDAWYYLGLIAKDRSRRIDAVKAFLKALEADDSLVGPPWARYIEPAETLTERAIGYLSEEHRSLLIGTEIVVLETPTKRQIQKELDPRQIVYAEGINPEDGVFERLWIFSKNLSRSGVIPENAAFELAQMIQNEIYPSDPNV